MAIYIVCGGSSVVNGLYYEIPGGWEKSADTDYTVRLTGTNWEIYHTPTDSVLYYLPTSYPALSVISTIGWISVNGNSPVVKSYEFNTSSITSMTVSGAGSSAVNGTYTYQSSILVDVGGNSESISGYVHSSGSYIITEYGSAVWYIQSIPYTTAGPLYISTAPTGLPFVQELFDASFLETGTPPGPLVSINDSVLCEDVTPPAYSGYFVYTKNNVHHIRKLSPQLGSEPTECPDGLYPEGWFCCPGGGAALTAGDCDIPGPNYMASPPVTNFFIRKQQ